MTSSIRAPRSDRADCSPSTQLMASLRLDLPQPLGPTTAAMPPPLKRSSVRSQKDLKPCSSTRFNFSKPVYLVLLGGIVTILNSSTAKVKYLVPSKMGPLGFVPHMLCCIRRPYRGALFLKGPDALLKVRTMKHFVAHAA